MDFVVLDFMDSGFCMLLILWFGWYGFVVFGFYRFLIFQVVGFGLWVV